VFVLLYTLLGGFLAESVSDFMQAIVMIIALAVIVTISTVKAGGIGAVLDNAQQIPGFLEFFGLATPTVDANGTQLLEAGKPLFGAASDYGLLTVFSMMAWGLGYFGMPQVLLRFMAIRKEKELDRSRRIAMIWVVISLAVAVFIGIIGRQLYPAAHLTKSASENIFITLATTSLPPILAGFVMAGILAATISSSDSYLLIAASAFAKNIFQGICKKNASDKQVMIVTRITLLALALVGILIALDEDSVIFQIVSFAWAGFGATFGPLMLFSLFWKRTNKAGAIAGMISGAGMVFLWKLVISKIGGVFAIYELLPAFIFSCVCILVVSLLTKAPSKEIQEDFDAVRNGTVLDA
jgi:sodium/proline symporter